MTQKDVPSKKNSFLELPQTKDLIKKFDQARDTFEKQLDEIQQKVGRSPKEIKEFFDNPNNFSKYKWEVIQKEKGRIQQILDNFEKDRNLKRLTNVANKPKKKNRLKKSRQNWIPM